MTCLICKELDCSNIKEICPVCEGSGCSTCDDTGFVDTATAEDLHDEITRKIIANIEREAAKHDEPWIDPAGGWHSGREKDPAAQYE